MRVRTEGEACNETFRLRYHSLMVLNSQLYPVRTVSGNQRTISLLCFAPVLPSSDSHVAPPIASLAVMIMP